MTREVAARIDDCIEFSFGEKSSFVVEQKRSDVMGEGGSYGARSFESARDGVVKDAQHLDVRIARQQAQEPKRLLRGAPNAETTAH